MDIEIRSKKSQRSKSCGQEGGLVNNEFGIAVIGSGHWGRNLVRNFHEIGALKLICDKNETVLTGFQKQYPDVDTCLAISDALSRKEIQSVVIATPAATHFTVAREALLAAKHVYVEKPLALDVADGLELIGMARERNLVLMVGHLLQYHPVFVRLKELTGAGELGRINYIYSHRLNRGKIRREENILWSFALHDISMILALAEDDPEMVMATGGAYLHKRIADVTTTHLEFPSGLRAHIFVSWLHPFKVQQLVVVGDRKMAVFDDTKPWVEKLLIYPHRITWQNNFPVPDKAEAEHVDICEAEPLRIECEHFLHCIENGCRPTTDGSEGLMILRILNLAQTSLDRSGAKMVLGQDARTENEAHGLKTAAETRKTDFFKHATAEVDDGCEIGKGTKLWRSSHVLSKSRIGENCTIGNGCKIQNNVSVYKGVTLEDDVFCGPSMVFTNIHNPRAGISKMDQVRPTRVRTGATLGANSTILCGRTLGRYAFIGAGAVVTKDVPDYAVVVGNPARQIGWVCRCGEILTESL